MQQAMLFHSLYAPGSGMYVLQMSLRLTGPLDLCATPCCKTHGGTLLQEQLSGPKTT